MTTKGQQCVGISPFPNIVGTSPNKKIFLLSLFVLFMSSPLSLSLFLSVLSSITQFLITTSLFPLSKPKRERSNIPVKSSQRKSLLRSRRYK